MKAKEYYDSNGIFCYSGWDDGRTFVLHSIDDRPAITKPFFKWYEHDKQYWYIENIKYFSLKEVYEKYKDWIVKIDPYYFFEIEDEIEYVGIESGIEYYVIIVWDETLRNELILRYG